MAHTHTHNNLSLTLNGAVRLALNPESHAKRKVVVCSPASLGQEKKGELRASRALLKRSIPSIHLLRGQGSCSSVCSPSLLFSNQRTEIVCSLRVRQPVLNHQEPELQQFIMCTRRTARQQLIWMIICSGASQHSAPPQSPKPPLRCTPATPMEPKLKVEFVEPAP